MRAAVLDGPESIDVRETERPTPDPREATIAVEASAVCGGDVEAYHEGPPGKGSVVPGHEVVGRVAEVGDGVTDLTTGDRVGVPWLHEACGRCVACSRGDEQMCPDREITGTDVDGGHAETLRAPAAYVHEIPEAFEPTEAAPLLCAGVTAHNGLRAAGASAEDRVAIQGIGGLGHLGVQVASAMGADVIAVSRGEDGRDAALELGADRYLDAEAVNVAETLRELGGADAALSTVPSGEAMSTLVGGLAENGTLAVVGAPSDPIELSARHLLDGDRAVVGASSGTRAERERHLAFCARHDIAPWTEEFPLRDVETALEAVEDGTVRFRAVLVP